MYGETAQSAGYPDGAKSLRPMPELGRLKMATERVAKARSDIECFIGRFNGNGHCLGGRATDQPDADCYRNDVGSLFEQIKRLEKVAEILRDIG